MLNINKLTDYALILLCEINDFQVISANELSNLTKIPLATTNKILKKLNKSNICKSIKGKNGGFLLNKPHNSISIYDVIISIVDNKPSFTDCANHNCNLIGHCKITKKMNIIDKEIYNIISNKFISDLF